MLYTLMNKNRPIAEIQLSDKGYIVAIAKVVEPEAFPVGVITPKASQTDIVKNLQEWWQSRIIPASRQGLEQLLAICGLETAAVLSVRSLGLSLSDQYWLRPDSELQWEDVNFFTNEFSLDFGETFFARGSSKPHINPFTPDASSNGWLKKKWTIIDGTRYLAKAGSGTLLQEPYNEVVAAKLMDLLGIEHVDYSITMEDKRPLCLCPNFITVDTEFVPAYFVKKVLRKNNNDSELAHLLRCAEHLGMGDIRRFINGMLSLDFLIDNTDRHYGNFGFIRDVNTLAFLGPAPIFDSGTSLWHDVPAVDIGTWQHAKPFKATQKEQLALISECDVKHAELTKCPDVVRSVLSQSPYLESNRVELVREAVAGRARLLQQHVSQVAKRYK